MIIVNAQQINKYHAANLILDNVTFQLQETEKVALIGRNGSGKSTLLRILSGHEPIDGGALSVKKDLKIGYLPQIPAEFERLTVYEVLAYGFRDLLKLKRDMADMEREMSSADAANHPDWLDGLLKRYTAVQERFEEGGGYEMETAIDQVANGLQIDRSNDGRPFGGLSGGEKTRVVLASQLVTRPDLLLLDEPTNHLDLKGIEWLEHYLQRYEGACVIVSHDRYFLDAVSSRTIELENGEAHTYLTGYSGYLKEKEDRLLQQFSLYQEQQKKIKKMNETIRQLEEWGRIGGNEKFFKRAASIRKALDKMEALKRPVMERKTAAFALAPQDRSGKRVLEFEDLSKTYGEKVILEGAEGSLLYGDKAVLLGSNGAGKTTLFQMLLGMVEPDEGTIRHGARLEIGYLAQQEPAQDPKQTVLDYFRTEGGLEEGEARHVLARYLFYGADVFKPLQSLSGGEWSRLRLALLVRRKPNLLLLDEPTNHLDVASREALEEALEEYPGTVLAISHDRYFINRIAGQVWELKDGKLTRCAGNYEDYKTRQNKMNNSGVGPKAAVHDVKGKKPRVTQAYDRADGKAVTTNRSGERLEPEIAALEKELSQMDMKLETIAQSGDAEELERLWREREVVQTRLDTLLELWLETGE